MTSRARPGLALVWLVLFVLMRLSVAAHQAFTVHVPCPVDGELAHAHGAGTGAHADEAEPAQDEPEPDRGHAEHCGFEPATQPVPPHTPAPVLLVRPAPERTVESPRPAPPRAGARRFLLAPKQSPPASVS